jgi:hypothetical protein
LHGLIPPLTFICLSIFGKIQQNKLDKPSVIILKEIFVESNGVDNVYWASGED